MSVTYDKEALSRFHKQNYLEALNGHTEYASANTLKNSVKLAINMDSGTERFKMIKRGGHYATTEVVNSSFE